MFTGIVEETGRVLRLERSGVFAALKKMCEEGNR